MGEMFEGATIGSLVLPNRVMRTACGDAHATAGCPAEGDLALCQELIDDNCSRTHTCVLRRNR